MNKNIQYIFKYLSVYMNASLDFNSALTLVNKRLKHKKLKKIMLSVQVDIVKGRSLRDAFVHLKSVGYIDDVVWSILSTVEYSGSLAQSFAYIGTYLKDKNKMQSSLVGALIYPVGMFLASISMVYFLITLVFPRILPLFSSMNVTLPLSARLILASSSFISAWGFYLSILVVFVSMGAVFLYMRKENFRYTFQYLYISIPYIGDIIKAKAYTNISRSIAMLMNNHKNIYDSFAVVTESTRLLPFKFALVDIMKSIHEGKNLTDEISKQKVFEHDWADLISVGEATGSLPKTFSDISDVYSEKYKDSINTLIRVSEPLALVCSAFVVLVVALAVIQPMYSLIQHVNGQ